MKLAIVGTGVSGLTAAYLLAPHHEVHVFESSDRPGGHSNTIACNDPRTDSTIAVDTGFIVYNERTYPLFTRLLAQLNVATQPSSMSLSVRCDATNLEYNGTSLATLFAQRRNFLRPSFYRMLAEILRFNKAALAAETFPGTLGSFLGQHRFSASVIDHYIIPMTAAIWSAPRSTVLDMPMRFFVSFFRNHGMLTVNDRPQWRTITGGSRTYVAALTAPFRERIRLACPALSIRRFDDHVEVTSPKGTERFDHVILASHSDESLALLADPSDRERDILSAIPYQSNEAVLHTDESLLPRTRRAWAAWNAHVDLAPDQAADQSRANAPTSVTYNLSILQTLPTPTQFLVTLNRTSAINPSHIIRTIHYRHPLFTSRSVAAQQRHHEISNVRRTHYCGAYWGYGFHEDGVRSAFTVARTFGVTLPGVNP
jgi:predicted NAD/FAD-binding protein